MEAFPQSEQISRELMDLLGAGRQVEPYSRRYADFTLARAYEVVARVASLRRAKGETPVGRKIGFTNRSLWGELGIAAPVWNYVFDRTVSHAANGSASVVLEGLPEPRIEPELVLHLARAPAAGMSARDLLGCIDWVAPGFEIVFSIFPGWSFTAADAAAAYGVHAALAIGERLALAGPSGPSLEQLSAFTVALDGPGGVHREGHAANVLGGPVQALKFLVDEIARYPGCEPLKAGEVITTGTLTEAMPVRGGERWRARFDRLALKPLALEIALR